MLERLSLRPNATGARHVRAGQILRVVEEHDVDQRTRGHQAGVQFEVRDSRGRPAVMPMPGLTDALTASPGDLVVELVDAGAGDVVSRGYMTGVAAQCYRWPESRDPTVKLYEPASVVRLTELEAIIEEALEAQASPERIAEIGTTITAALATAKDSDHDLALLDIEAGDQYQRVLPSIEHWWRLGGARRESDRTCCLLTRVVRNRRIVHSRFRRAPGVLVQMIQPARRAGLPGTMLMLQATIEAGLPS